MRILLQIVDDNGEILAEHSADASTPSQWRVQTGQKFISAMPSQSDQKNTGTYELFGITVQPHVRVDRPNGWTAPPPQPQSPFPGQNSFRGEVCPSRPQTSWGPPSSPTKAVSAPVVGNKSFRG